MTLRDVFEGIGSLWSWYIDLPIWFSLPLGLGVFVATGVAIFIGMMIFDGSDPTG